jgi:hypothetical protein
MSENEKGARDTECIKAFQDLIAKRKVIPNKKLSLQKLEDLTNIYEVLNPFLPVSELCRQEIQRILTEAVNIKK